MSDWNTPRRYRPRKASDQNAASIAQDSPLPLLIPSFLPKSSVHLEKHLAHRVWLNTFDQDIVRQNSRQYFKFHLVCYNILAQLLLEETSYLYEKCLKTNLKWDRRQDRLFKEFFRQDADILCLQEIQIDHYENQFRPRLMEYGYESIYLKRSRNKSDGCCIFYKSQRLKLIESKAVPFYHSNIRILDRDNCGLIALFQPLTANATSDDLFCVATTHLLFSPQRGDIKLAQIQYFLAEIDQLALKDPERNSYHPIILCGDFNAQPYSPLIQFLLTGHIQYNNYRCVDISGQEINHRFSYQLPFNQLLPPSFVTSDCRLSTSPRPRIDRRSLGILTHNKSFKSVYDLHEPFDVTANSADEPHLVDYIFYTQQDNDPDRLNVLSRFELYKQAQMSDIHLPNHQFPSDHFLLAGKFALKLRNKDI